MSLRGVLTTLNGTTAPNSTQNISYMASTGTKRTSFIFVRACTVRMSMFVLRSAVTIIYSFFLLFKNMFFVFTTGTPKRLPSSASSYGLGCGLCEIICTSMPSCLNTSRVLASLSSLHEAGFFRAALIFVICSSCCFSFVVCAFCLLGSLCLTAVLPLSYYCSSSYLLR